MIYWYKFKSKDYPKETVYKTIFGTDITTKKLEFRIRLICVYATGGGYNCYEFSKNNFIKSW